MGRMLEPASYGALAAVISLIGLLGLLSSSVGLVVTKIVAGAKDENEISARISVLNKHVWFFGLIFFLPLLAISGLIAEFMKIERILLILGLVVFLLSFPVNLARSTLQGLLRFKSMVISQSLENIIRLCGAIVLVLAGFSIMGGILGMLFGVLFGWFAAWLYVKKFFQFSTEKNLDIKFASTLKSSIPFFVVSISMTSFYSSDLILVKHFFSSFDAGIYAAMSFLGRIIFFAVSPITAVIFPIAARNSSEGKNSSDILLCSLFAGAGISIVITGLYWLMPEVVVNMLYGDKYSSAGDILVLFGVFMTFVTLSFLLLNYELARGRHHSIFISALAAVCQIVLIWLYHSSLLLVAVISTVTSLVLFIYLMLDVFYFEKGSKK